MGRHHPPCGTKSGLRRTAGGLLDKWRELKMNLRPYAAAKSALAAAAAAVLLTAMGCGGSGSGGSVNKSFTGIWSGRTTNSASGAMANVYVQFTQTGNTFTGVSFVDNSGIITTGTSNGTITGNTATANIDYGATAGTAAFTYTLSGNTLTGNYTRSLNGQVVETGTLSFTRSTIQTTSNVAASYAGTTQMTGSTTTKPLSFTIAQNGNTLTLTNGTSNTNTFTGAGVVVGDNIGCVLNITGGTDTVDIFGTLSGSTFTGAYWEPGTNSGNNGVVQTGIFTISAVNPK
jgi:hypothetical protein